MNRPGRSTASSPRAHNARRNRVAKYLSRFGDARKLARLAGLQDPVLARASRTSCRCPRPALLAPLGRVDSQVDRGSTCSRQLRRLRGRGLVTVITVRSAAAPLWRRVSRRKPKLAAPLEHPRADTRTKRQSDRDTRSLILDARARGGAARRSGSPVISCHTSHRVSEMGNSGIALTLHHRVESGSSAQRKEPPSSVRPCSSGTLHLCDHHRQRHLQREEAVASIYE